ncbi:MAG: glycerophosphodiester phosphodiesterase [Gammaproteobacteria bacterium]|nr:glycerophosphodiester phosphodiesterase [Gammaproteobacteria bacterium]
MALPIVIAHRGASGYVPEHTLASYYIAMQCGADFIEPDLVMTRDGVLIARHENEIGGTTDVAEHPEFAARRTRRCVDGQWIEGWFSEDFTLAEIKALRARERIPALRPGNAHFDGLFEIPTLAEILALLEGFEAQRAVRGRELTRVSRPVGVYPETKHPTYFAARGLALEPALVATLSQHGYRGRDPRVWLQSFEPGSLQTLARLCELPRVQLLESAGAPFDLRHAGDARTFADLMTNEGLAATAGYAQAIGPDKTLVIPRRPDGSLGAATDLTQRAHSAGLQVHPWTFRAENHFLPTELRRGEDDAGRGDLQTELLAYLRAGVDGFFTDQTDLGVAARRAFTQAPPETQSSSARLNRS